MKLQDLILILLIVIAGTSFVALMTNLNKSSFESNYICKLQDKVTMLCSPK